MNMRRLFYLVSVILLLDGCGENTPLPKDVKCYLLKSSSTSSLSDAVEEENYEFNTENILVKKTTVITSSSHSETWSETYEYGSNGKLSKATGSNYHRSYSYNASGQLISVSYYTDDILESTSEFVYSSSGQLIRRHDPEGYLEWKYTDSQSQNAIKASYFDHRNMLHFFTEYEYDDKPRPSANIITNKSSSVNNITKSTYTQVTGLPTVSVTSFDYQYDDQGFPQAVTGVSTRTSDGYTFTSAVEYAYVCR